MKKEAGAIRKEAVSPASLPAGNFGLDTDHLLGVLYHRVSLTLPLLACLD
jgi:hypothetical protein